MAARKHVWGVTDPFRFPPSEFNFGVLQAVEPFLNIHRHQAAVSQLPFDRFKGGKMNADALDACLHLISASMADFERSYNERITELNFRPRHLELIRQVEKFTTPTDAEYNSSFLESIADGDEDELDQKGFVILLSGENDALEEVEAILHEDSNASGSDSSSSDGSHLDTEAPPQGPYDVADTGRTDGRAFVFNEGPRKRTECEVERLRLSAQRCAFISEFKPNETWEAIAQAAACARPEVRCNLSNRHYKPMYLLALSKHKFTYAILKAEGQILAGDFVETTRPSGQAPTSKAVIDRMFALGTKFLRENYREKSGAKYLKRPFIVGDLYIAPEWYPLPSNEVDGGFFSSGAKKFYEGLLRIAIGDVVLRYTQYDLLKAAGIRMAQSLKQGARGGANIHRVVMLDSMLQMIALACLGGNHYVEPDPSKRRRLSHEEDEKLLAFDK
ncbi:hypothetical protein SELMODRAFT_402085 [Selaginella moellendorffii]|uniref:Uncharacterized protein n=1 Tax=Selaginella moellendorffii TaxID=88036 RepID=D8QPJ1_SELML|nr:hypothetical protein SELMODRAFT_402085 [Selaginella moellendorffii]